MKATEILSRAYNLVGNEREQQYGDKAEHFERTAFLWSTYIGVRENTVSPFAAYFSPQDVGIMMALFKIARMQAGKFTIDNYVDACGYIACAGEVVARRLEKQNQDKKP